MQHFTNYCYIFNHMHTNYCYRYNHICTLWLKSLWPLASVWSKITLNTGNMCGARADPQTLKMSRFFLMSLALCMPIFNNFQKYGTLGGTLNQKFPLLLL